MGCLNDAEELLAVNFRRAIMQAMDDRTTVLFRNYVTKPSIDNYLQLREAVAASPEYAPYGTSPDKACPLFDEGKFEEATALLRELIGNFLLNPRLHQFLSFAWHQQGNEDKAGFEFGIAKRCLDGILLTGSGEKEKPYLVLHVEDEYDVLRHLQKKPQTQSLVRDAERAYDVFQCEDGSSIWFDISIPHGYLASRYQ
jgi:Domain of unknown function (DUF4919)